MIDKNNILEIFPTPLYVVTDVLSEEENDEEEVKTESEVEEEE